MLSNAYFLAKIRFDTAENEPAKNLQKFANFANFANPNLTAVLRTDLRDDRAAHRARPQELVPGRKAHPSAHDCLSSV